ncbi:hypothetical protein CKA32_001236 [Geitlerinema sp. FC II]|uniref:hypothetical protein n=1 Tax=Baaleninema simplex TaxID=2862350 RepID=UPI000345B635|nr:hypothetical protein [Baaleninema simplex]PPT10721.1 hypothetical protein CKA32_001236 [Geitlerinema sp. FC II]
MHPINLISEIKTRPWISFGLFLVTYMNLGWVLSDSEASRWPWIWGIGLTILLAEALASPWSVVRNVAVRWLKSDIRGFITALLAAFVAVIFLTWLHVSSHIILLASAGLLFRLDVQIAGLSDLQAFLLLLGTSMSGLGLGWLAHFILNG